MFTNKEITNKEKRGIKLKMSEEQIIGLYIKTLAPDVLCVAKVNKKIGDWTAYIKGISGTNYKKDIIQVANWGSKLPYKIAKLLFPTLDKKFTWRE